MQPAVEEPPTPMKLTFAIEIRGATGLALETIEVDASPPGQRFGAAGKQMGEQFVTYMNNRLACWTSPQ